MPSFMIVRLQTSEIKRGHTDTQTDTQTHRRTDNVIYIYTSGFAASACGGRANFRLRRKVRGTPPAFGRRGAWSHEELRPAFGRIVEDFIY